MRGFSRPVSALRGSSWKTRVMGSYEGFQLALAGRCRCPTATSLLSLNPRARRPLVALRPWRGMRPPRRRRSDATATPAVGPPHDAAPRRARAASDDRRTACSAAMPTACTRSWYAVGFRQDKRYESF